MKNITFKSILFLSIIVLSSFAVKDSFVKVKKILGEWECSIPDAPMEYQKGVLVLSRVDGVLAAEMVMGGQGMPLEDVVYEKDVLKGKMDVQGETVRYNLNFTKKSFEGIVSYSQGTLDITGTKK
ncbi:hypothetical protein QWY87_17210 [Lutimonas halocynthiae]|uniref:hypothetical protein n=1 Tax=Lutimonas halocynthiae TaxID=1446477 RepID=UPI0025B5D3D7|nr:hypothetical protein [Lutimonas halocynthiae]MDN3644456.1 hypothetical protein [Lutimonas halocynthiae]